MVELSEHTEDKVLWHDLKEGNKRCFNQLFRKYYSELYYYGIKIFSDPDFVKECIQEVFYTCLGNPKKFGRSGKCKILPDRFCKEDDTCSKGERKR